VFHLSGPFVEPTLTSFTTTSEWKHNATAGFFAALYSELHRMAQRQLVRYGGPITLGATTLLHQTYVNLAERSGPSFPDRPHFLAYAARAMRGLIIDHARRRQGLKRGGRFEITLLNLEAPNSPVDDRELILIGDALDELAAIDASLAELVDLKFFCGFSFAEIASMRGVSERTVQRNWEKARIYLHRSIRPDVPL
jgi:RNA polymerase sigma factor (TIGR02999 family)